MSDKINYAHFFGVESIAGAVIFAIAYLPLFAWFLLQSVRRPTYVYGVLTIFCASEFCTFTPFFFRTNVASVRIAAFTIRAVLAGSESAGETLGLFIADQILFGVGFFGLLYSAYTLVLDRYACISFLDFFKLMEHCHQRTSQPRRSSKEHI